MLSTIKMLVAAGLLAGVLVLGSMGGNAMASVSGTARVRHERVDSRPVARLVTRTHVARRG